MQGRNHIRFALSSGEKFNSLLDLAENRPTTKSLINAASDFADSLSIETIPLPDAALSEVLELYFSGEAPFGAKDKKSEFPDAINMVALLSHSKRAAKPVYVVSADDDWKRACSKRSNLVYVQHLSEMIDKAIRAEWLSTDLWSDEELLRYLGNKTDELASMLGRALSSSSVVNLGDGKIHDLSIDSLYLEGLAITSIRESGEAVLFEGELFHAIDYFANTSIEDDEFMNTIEEEFSGSADLIASIEILIPLAHPEKIEIMSVEYKDGLNLQIPLEF